MRDISIAKHKYIHLVMELLLKCQQLKLAMKICLDFWKPHYNKGKL